MIAPATIRDFIRTLPDFPRKGVQFRDVTTLFADPRGFRLAIDLMMQQWQGTAPDKIAGIEARGFIPGGVLAHALSAGFIAIRKAGKLPGGVIAESYTLEYGEAVIELHKDALVPGERVLIIDDLLATGGTAEAGIHLCRRLGAEVVGAGFIVDLPELGGRERIEALDVPVHALCAFEGM